MLIWLVVSALFRSVGLAWYNFKLNGPVAQSVEQRIENPCVGGSIPPQATIIQRPTFFSWAFLFVLRKSPVANTSGHLTNPNVAAGMVGVFVKRVRANGLSREKQISFFVGEYKYV